jgi:phosphoserine phosphatase RsbU/P
MSLALTTSDFEIRSQLDCILHITEAINMNVSVDSMLTMYFQYLHTNMGIRESVLIIQLDGDWQAIHWKHKHPGEIKKERIVSPEVYLDNKSLSNDTYTLQVKHKNTPIAFAYINDPSYSSERQVFINSITNIIAVAIENKRLFKKQIEQERYRKEIELASEVQKMLIPGRIPRSNNIDIAAIYKPQLNIGGDYYDFIERKPGEFIFCVADISGKGVAAALLMANFQATLRYAIKQYDALTDVVHFLNAQLIQTMHSERIITLFIGKYDAALQTLEYINAGHAPPFLVTSDTIQILKEGCTLLGAFDELPEVRLGKTTISNEVVLMAYTDGLTDLQNDAGVYFDEYCLKFFLLEHHRKDVEGIVNALVEEMDTFKGRQDYPDDIAILVCKIKP